MIDRLQSGNDHPHDRNAKFRLREIDDGDLGDADGLQTGQLPVDILLECRALDAGHRFGGKKYEIAARTATLALTATEI